MQNNDLAVVMRLGMRRLASGVCVLSTCVGETERFAMTVSSVTSVSDSPASLLVCINQLVSRQEHLSTVGSHFAINVLGQEHQAISNLCAGRAPEKNRFEIGDWVDHQGVPVLADAPAVFICETDKVTSYGTHHIIIALIKDVLIASDPSAALIYADGSYGKFAPDELSE